MRRSALAAAALTAAALAAPGLRAEERAPAGTGQISGSVLSPSRQPVRGASVAVLPESGSTLHGTSTGDDGRYALRNLEPGVYSVLVLDPGGALLRKDRVHARPLFRNLVDFVAPAAAPGGAHLPSLAPAPGGEAPPAFDLHGLVLSAEGAPVPEAWAAVAPVGTEAPTLRARTDAEGKFRLLRIPCGYYRITVRSLGRVTWSLGPLLFGEPGERSLKLTLLPFMLGQPENPEDLLVPLDPATPEAFEKEP
jgi:hypothetical protein